ncbi:MAG TPA: hypothetical protein VHL58_06545 [Thermoanaerobaculia bacterium]|nr:hypothetical protein [Thermoanaerobaculia bacterium]
MKKNSAERRGEPRMALGEAIVACFGSSVVLVVDLSAKRRTHRALLETAARRRTIASNAVG